MKNICVLTEVKAEEKVCPNARAFYPQGSSKCLGGRCMGWVWKSPPFLENTLFVSASDMETMGEQTMSIFEIPIGWGPKDGVYFDEVNDQWKLDIIRDKDENATGYCGAVGGRDDQLVESQTETVV